MKREIPRAVLCPRLPRQGRFVLAVFELCLLPSADMPRAAAVRESGGAKILLGTKTRRKGRAGGRGVGGVGSGWVLQAGDGRPDSSIWNRYYDVNRLGELLLRPGSRPSEPGETLGSRALGEQRNPCAEGDHGPEADTDPDPGVDKLGHLCF